MLFNHRPVGYRDFKLSPAFLEKYKDKPVAWGYGGLSYFVYKRTYAKQLADNSTEEWWQTIKRVVEGVYNVQKLHCAHLSLP